MPRSGVDGSLFAAKGKAAPKADIAIVSAKDIASMREDLQKGKAPREAGIVTANELARIKASTKIQTKQETLAQKKIQDEQKEQQQAAAKARKLRMVAMDQERSSKVKPTDIEVESKQKEVGLLAKAQKQIDEEHDDVKHMNQMVLYSKVVTIRDKQLEENKDLESNWVEEQKRLDLMMEIERLKGLQAAEERERKRVEAQRRGAAVIIDQIKDREQQRMREREILEKEQVQMARTIELMKEQDLKQAEAKRLKNKQMLAEVEVSNKLAQDAKQVKIVKEKEEEMEIVRYNKARIEKEEARLAEERRLKAEKEEEIQRLRELQEKAADRQAEIDALRAKRAFEEGERNARLKERQEAEKRAKQAADLEIARRRQYLEKEISLANQAKTERDAFLKVIDAQKAAEEQDRKMMDERQHAFHKHAHTIRNQITKNEEQKKQERMDYLEEGRKVRQKQEEERLKVENIKKEKLNSLSQLGIEEKYKADLSKKKII